MSAQCGIKRGDRIALTLTYKIHVAFSHGCLTITKSGARRFLFCKPFYYFASSNSFSIQL